MSTDVPLLNVQIDGVWMQFPKGTRVIEACAQAGKFIPRYCYHPKLSAPGNCRMCMVEMGMPKMGPDRKPIIGEDGRAEIGWIPRPQISCAQDVAEGMGIRTDSPMVQECRKGVMEFLLINHPLDCPICDQAGECRLQEFSVEYGNSTSRFLERKVKKPKNIELGPRVTLDAERCVLCSRCIRFMKEVAKDDVLGFVDRGSFSTIACHPDKTLESNYSLNTVDICPVGALTSTDFRFKMRVWFLKETKTIDVNDGLGCNITIGSRENKVYRITPRENNEVNGVWLPDSHRLNYKYLADESRITAPSVNGKQSQWSEALSNAINQLKSVSGKVAMVASARLTNEELYLARRLATALGITLIDIVARTGQPDGILIPEDRNPNTSGARLLGLAAKESAQNIQAIVSGIKSGAVKGVISFGEDLTDLGLVAEDLKKLEALVVTAILPTGTTPYATVILPGAAWAEKRGSMINIKGRLQRLNRAVNAPGQSRDDWEIIRDLLEGCGQSTALTEIEDVFRVLTQDVNEFSGINLSKIGDLGIQILSKSESAVSATA
ncbi:MAG: molybdopterin-dependent oxidoreductase [Verrucomicrobiota bacterium]